MDELQYVNVSKKALKGTVTLQVLGIRWSNGEVSVSSSRLRSMMYGVVSTYAKTSRGLLRIKAKAAIVKVPYAKKLGNLGKAERYAMNRFPGKNYYAIVNGGLKKFSNANGKVAHLRGTLITTACHEVGHLFGLGHAGKYGTGPKYGLNSYGDHQSFMGNMSSSALSAPQYYHLGWLDHEEVVRHKPEYGKKTYTLRAITDYNKKGLAAVMIPQEGRNAFVSITDWLSKKNRKQGRESKRCITLHLAKHGSSQKIKMFGTAFHDTRFTGLNIEKVKEENGLVTITIEKI